MIDIFYKKTVGKNPKSEAKGLPAFSYAAALSLPSLIMLSKAVKPKLLFWFIVIVVAGIIAIGYIFNALDFIFVREV